MSRRTGEHSVFLRMLETQHREVFERTLAGRWLHVAVDPVKNQHGVVKGALGIVSDVTDRRELEEELRRRAEDLAAADRRKDEFLAMLAHELRNPLAPILNCLELIRHEAATNPHLEQLLEIPERQVQHMARLLDDLLDVSRFTQGKIQLRKETLDVVYRRGARGRDRHAARRRQGSSAHDDPPAPSRYGCSETRPGWSRWSRTS